MFGKKVKFIADWLKVNAAAHKSTINAEEQNTNWAKKRNENFNVFFYIFFFFGCVFCLICGKRQRRGGADRRARRDPVCKVNKRQMKCRRRRLKLLKMKWPVREESLPCPPCPPVDAPETPPEHPPRTRAKGQWATDFASIMHIYMYIYAQKMRQGPGWCLYIYTRTPHPHTHTHLYCVHTLKS